MKATDLMIGDWVHTSLTDECQKIWGIRETGVILCNDDFCPYFYLEPIPITPEILEKNGFRWTGSGDRTMMCGTPYDFEGIRYNLYVGLGKKYIEVHAAMTEKKDERWRKVNKTYLEVCGCYVHELQHALKLCGIDKEITL